MTIYHSPQGAETIRKAVQAAYSTCPQPWTEIKVQGKDDLITHVMALGEEGAEPLVLLHGSSGNSTAWFGMLASLTATFRVFLVDIPGQPGLSDPRRLGLAAGESRPWLEDLLDGLGLNSTHFGGLSLGAWMALDFALTAPHRVKALALISPSGLRPPKAGFFFRVLPLSFMGPWGAHRIYTMIHGPVPVHPGMAAFGNLVSRNYKPMTEQPPVFEDRVLSSLQPPLLFIGGDRDVMLDMPGSAGRLERILPSCRRILRPGFSHVLPDEGETLRGFFSEYGGSNGVKRS